MENDPVPPVAGVPVTETNIPTLAEFIAQFTSQQTQMQQLQRLLAEQRAELDAIQSDALARQRESAESARQLGALRHQSARGASQPQDLQQSFQDEVLVGSMVLAPETPAGGFSTMEVQSDETFQAQAFSIAAEDTLEEQVRRWEEGHLTGMMGLDSGTSLISPVSNPMRAASRPAAPDPPIDDVEQARPFEPPDNEVTRDRARRQAALDFDCLVRDSIPDPLAGASSADSVAVQSDDAAIADKAGTSSSAIAGMSDAEVKSLYDNIETLVRDDLTRELKATLTSSLETTIRAELQASYSSQYRIALAKGVNDAKEKYLRRGLEDSEAEIARKTAVFDALDQGSRTMSLGESFQDKAQTRVDNNKKEGDFSLNGVRSSAKRESLITKKAEDAAEEHRVSTLARSGITSVVHTPITFKTRSLQEEELDLLTLKGLLDQMILHSSREGNKPPCGLAYFGDPVKSLLLKRYNQAIMDSTRRQEFSFEPAAVILSMEVALYLSGPLFQEFLRVSMCPRDSQAAEALLDATFLAVETKHNLVANSQNILSARQILPFLEVQKEKLEMLLCYFDWYAQFHSVDGRDTITSNCPGIKPNKDTGLKGAMGVFMSGAGYGLMTTKGSSANVTPVATLRETLLTILQETGTTLPNKARDSILHQAGRFKSMLSNWEKAHRMSSKHEGSFSMSLHPSGRTGALGIQDRAGSSSDPLAIKYPPRRTLQDASSAAPAISAPKAETSLTVYKRTRSHDQDQSTIAPSLRRRLQLLQNRCNEECDAEVANHELRASYELDHINDRNEHGGLFVEGEDNGRDDENTLNSDVRLLLAQHAAIDFGSSASDHTSLNCETIEENPPPIRYAYREREYDVVPSDIRSRLQNLNPRGELANSGDSRLRTGPSNPHPGRPPEEKYSRGAMTREPTRDARHESRYPRGDNPSLFDPSKRSMSPATQLRLSLLPCDSWSMEGTCNRVDCPYSHADKPGLDKYLLMKPRMEQLLAKQKLQSAQHVAVPHSAMKGAQVDASRASRIQVLRRDSSRSGVAFDMPEMPDHLASEHRALAGRVSDWRDSVLANMSRQPASDEWRPTKASVGDNHDDTSSYGYSSTDEDA